MERKSILFVFHDATLTGSNLVLLRYVKALKATGLFSLSFIVGKKGRLIKELSSLGPLFVAEPEQFPAGIIKRVIKKIANRVRKQNNKWEKVKLFADKQQPDLVYCNTVVTIPYIKNVFAAGGCRIILHVHELELAYSILRQDINAVKEDISLFIANSESTLKFIHSCFNIPESKIAVHYPILPQDSKDGNAKLPDIAGEIIIGSSGTGLGRKGIFSFIELAVLLKKRMAFREVKFVWVGNIQTNEIEIKHDLQKLGLQETIIFPGEVERPLDYYQRFTAFITLSKEESFGLACAEAASLGIPLFGYSNTGGGEELIASAGGVIVPYLDLEAMADAIVDALKDPVKLENMKLASTKASQRYTPESLSLSWMQTINNCLNH